MGIPIVSQVFTFIYNIFNVIRSLFYDWLFKPSNPVSTQWGYYEILKLLPDNITILDVGVGDGIYWEFGILKIFGIFSRKSLPGSASPWGQFLENFPSISPTTKSTN